MLFFLFFLFIVVFCRHEDGTVKFWSARTSSMDLVYVLNVAQLFDGYVDPNDATPEEEGWPPFRKVCEDFLCFDLLHSPTRSFCPKKRLRK